MSCLFDIGSGVGGKIAEYTVEPVLRQVGYLVHYQSNLGKLRTEVDVLSNSRDRMQHRVNEALKNGKAIETDVLEWQKSVDDITEKAKRFFEEDERHAKTKCFPGCCCSLSFRYKLSRDSKKIVMVVVDLIAKDFPIIFYTKPPQDVYNIPTRDYIAFKSRISTVDYILEVLRDPNNLIGVYGFRGIGKTTLVKEVVRQAENKKLFDDVAMVLEVSQTPESERIERIQKEIAENVGLSFPENQSIAGKARILCDRIKDTKILVILDDVSERIDLELVGLPSVPTCKVLLTSRSREVLSSKMLTQKDIHLQALKEDENWSLFEKRAGDIVKDSAIRTVATQIAQKCECLPVLTDTVARILKNRTDLSAWKDAFNHLEMLDQLEMKKKIYLVQVLEWSYSHIQLDEEASSISEQRFEEEIATTTMQLFMNLTREVRFMILSLHFLLIIFII